MLNKAQLIGRVGQDLELRYTQGGTAVATMNVATNRVWKDGDGERREQTEWHQVVLWGKAARAACDVLAKGRLVYVDGRLRTRTWEDEAGKHYRTEVVAESWQVLDRRPLAEVLADDDAEPAEVAEPLEEAA